MEIIEQGSRTQLSMTYPGNIRPADQERHAGEETGEEGDVCAGLPNAPIQWDLASRWGGDNKVPQ